jgi:hypothetical protein
LSPANPAESKTRISKLLALADLLCRIYQKTRCPLPSDFLRPAHPLRCLLQCPNQHTPLWFVSSLHAMAQQAGQALPTTLSRPLSRAHYARGHKVATSPPRPSLHFSRGVEGTRPPSKVRLRGTRPNHSQAVSDAPSPSSGRSCPPSTSHLPCRWSRPRSSRRGRVRSPTNHLDSCIRPPGTGVNVAGLQGPRARAPQPKILASTRTEGGPHQAHITQHSSE